MTQHLSCDPLHLYAFILPHKVVEIGTALLSFIVEQLKDIDMDRADVVVLRAELSRVIGTIIQHIQFRKMFEHKCSGMSVAALQEEWIGNGRPKEKLIRLATEKDAANAACAY